MNDKRLVLIHTVSPLVAVFDKLVPELLRGVHPMHILDEPLLERVRLRGHLAPEDSERLGAHVIAAEQVAGHAVLVTCSTISPCVDDVRTRAGIPVVKIDEAMISEAVATGARIGIVATSSTTMEPTRRLLQARAHTSDKAIVTDQVLVEQALPALLGGDGATHDRLVKEQTLELAQRVDVVVLAQASMARVLEAMPEAERTVPILSSPHLALAQVGGLLEATRT